MTEIKMLKEKCSICEKLLELLTSFILVYFVFAFELFLIAFDMAPINNNDNLYDGLSNVHIKSPVKNVLSARNDRNSDNDDKMDIVKESKEQTFDP